MRAAGWLLSHAEPALAPAHAVVRYPYFDYLRGLLAAGVVIAHAGGLESMFRNMAGNFCVQVFFALSGFLIGGILLETSRSELPRFYFNRCTRIWIPYALAVVLLLLGCLVLHQPGPRLAELFFYKITFVYNLFVTPENTPFHEMPLNGTGHHFWSICVEEQFYLFAPLLMVLVRWRVLFVLAVALLLALLPDLIEFFASITLGVALAMSKQRFGAWYLTRRATALLTVLFVASTTALQLGSSYLATAPIAAASLVALLARPGADLPLGEWVGGMSYPLYLNHWLGLVLRKKVGELLGLSDFGTGVFAFLFALAMAVAHYGLIDRTIRRVRGGWYSRRVGIACCTAAYGLLVAGLIAGATFAWQRPARSAPDQQKQHAVLFQDGQRLQRQM